MNYDNYDETVEDYDRCSEQSFENVSVAKLKDGTSKFATEKTESLNKIVQLMVNCRIETIAYHFLYVFVWYKNTNPPSKELFLAKYKYLKSEWSNWTAWDILWSVREYLSAEYLEKLKFGLTELRNAHYSSLVLFK